MGDPMTPCDITPVYTRMNENFKGGLNNVMPRYNDPVDSRCHQRCVDIGHGHAHQCVGNRSGRRGGSVV